MLKLIRAAYKNRALIDVTSESVLVTFGDKSPGHYNRLVAIVRAAMNLAVARGWIESAPKISRRKVKARSFRWLTRKEWTAVYEQLSEPVKPMALFAVSTGLRWSNVANLTWESVDMRRKQAWIEAGDAKGSKGIAIPLSASAIAALQLTGKRRAGYVFAPDGVPMKSPRKGWDAAVLRAKVPRARWHDLRHTWASWHVQEGTPLKALQELGGWASLDQVQIYAHLAPSAMASFADNARVPTGKAA